MKLKLVPAFAVFFTAAINIICLVGMFPAGALASSPDTNGKGALIIEESPLDRKIREQAQQGIFRVYARTKDGGITGGTGFLIRGHVITNKHVCEGIKKTRATPILDQEAEQYVGRAMKISKKVDLCEISVDSSLTNGRTQYELGDREPRTADRIMIIGHPHLGPLTRTDGMYVRTMVDDYQTTCPYRTSMCTVPILPGNSGSPVLNANGEVIGVAFAMFLGELEGYTAYVPLAELKAFLEDNEH